MKLFSFFVLVIFGVTASNATFHRKNNFKHFQFTMDVNGFHNHNHGLAFHQLNGQFGPPPPPLPMYGPPPPPVYGPPPFPHFHHHPHHHPHHKHTPDCNHKPEEDGMANTNTMSIPPIPYNPSMNHNPMPFIPNINNPVPSITNPLPFNPTMISPFNFNPNFPFNPQNFGNQNSNTFNGGYIPSNTFENNNNNNNLGYDSNNSVNNPTNLPADPLPTSESTYDTNTIRPLDANTVFYPSGLSTSTPSIFNADNKPQYTSEAAGPTDATTSQFATNNKNNDNNYNGNDAAIATNNDTDITNNNQPIVPGVSEPTVTPSSTQGNYNGLDYDIDVRFGDSKPNNSSNQKPVDTIK
ncbi:putative uncharacterized protein DDB_G0282133 isoform X1 [Contarinia nasturtii]|uniref:putative uncharacterized protein DDB_G0282133 isoform X1 n=1 Tax=Contarinia nasturtii TaxID=265458 RepID=UPI0012D4490C|nr:putative uncharacterized protein DDB_G0282133 isoform X1 [Contarinia nasturtii]